MHFCKCFFRFCFWHVYNCINTGGQVTHCNTTDCIVDCSDKLSCTDRYIMVDVTIRHNETVFNPVTVELLLGTFSGYGTTTVINIDLSAIGNDNDSMTRLTLPQIDLLINASSIFGTGYAMKGYTLLSSINKASDNNKNNNNNHSLNIPINLVLNCDTENSCHDSVFELDNNNNVTIMCNGYNSCSDLALYPTKGSPSDIRDNWDDWTVINNANIICNGDSSCENIQFSVQGMVILNANFRCDGVNSCAELSFRALNFDVYCNNEDTCSMLGLYGIGTVQPVLDLGLMIGSVHCNGESSCNEAVIQEYETLFQVNVQCNGASSCYDLRLISLDVDDTSNTTIINSYFYTNQTLNLNCDGYQACVEMQIFCPIYVPSKS